MTWFFFLCPVFIPSVCVCVCVCVCMGGYVWVRVCMYVYVGMWMRVYVFVKGFTHDGNKLHYKVVICISAKLAF